MRCRINDDSVRFKVFFSEQDPVRFIVLVSNHLKKYGYCVSSEKRSWYTNFSVLLPRFQQSRKSIEMFLGNHSRCGLDDCDDK